MRARHGDGATHGLAPGLVVDDLRGWVPATALVRGGPAALDDLLDAAKQRWNAPTHVAAALAWKSYSYWVALPAVLGWAAARRVPPVRAEDVLVRYADHQPFLQVALRRPDVAVLPSSTSTWLRCWPASATGHALAGVPSWARWRRASRTAFRAPPTRSPAPPWTARTRCWRPSASPTWWSCASCPPVSCRCSGAPAAWRSPCPSRGSAPAAASALIRSARTRTSRTLSAQVAR